MPRVEKNYDDKLLRRLLTKVGKMVAHYRGEVGMTQRELAAASGLSLSTVNEIEKCYVNDIRFSTLTTLASALGVDPLKMLASVEPSLSDAERKQVAKAIKVLTDLERRLT